MHTPFQFRHCSPSKQRDKLANKMCDDDDGGGGGGGGGDDGAGDGDDDDDATAAAGIIIFVLPHPSSCLAAKQRYERCNVYT